ncbi:hypothetical protein KEM54_000366 [Ascosphaera aggregata]|nr:hypothetical protein KEM54_000366 [Ascosphaera aggregata]
MTANIIATDLLQNTQRTKLQGEKEKAAMTLSLLSTGRGLTGSSVNRAVLSSYETTVNGTEASNNRTKSVNNFAAFVMMQPGNEWLDLEIGPSTVLDPALPPSAADFAREMHDRHLNGSDTTDFKNALTGLPSEAELNGISDFAASDSESSYRLCNGDDSG